MFVGRPAPDARVYDFFLGLSEAGIVEKSERGTQRRKSQEAMFISRVDRVRPDHVVFRH